VNKILLFCFAGLLWMTVLPLFGQDGLSSETPQSHPALVRAVYITGKVSGDGRSLSMGDDEDVWTVTNPRAFRGFEGREVTAKCYLDLEKSLIHVLSVKRDSTQMTYARSGDAAFRR
jgi:hypothetical protein